jgi:integrase
LDQILAACAGDSLTDLRDRAILLAAFASGGRRRSEIASLRCEQLREEEPVASEPAESPLPCLSIRLCRTKTTASGADATVLLVGRPALALKAWLERANIAKGPVFRAIDRWGNLEARALTPQAVNLILKRRIAQAGMDPVQFSAHGLRVGYLTESARRGIPLPEVMQQSQHKSVRQASNYYNEALREPGQAARLSD